ncbi:MAG: hypothetical protein KGY38_02670, partial [Desulfobacterales bacterium]|nr:hypothetical protein [Desulfobacterales bacterium]
AASVHSEPGSNSPLKPYISKLRKSKKIVSARLSPLFSFQRSKVSSAGSICCFRAKNRHVHVISVFGKIDQVFTSKEIKMSSLTGGKFRINRNPFAIPSLYF